MIEQPSEEEDERERLSLLEDYRRGLAVGGENEREDENKEIRENDVLLSSTPPSVCSVPPPPPPQVSCFQAFTIKVCVERNERNKVRKGVRE